MKYKQSQIKAGPSFDYIHLGAAGTSTFVFNSGTLFKASSSRHVPSSITCCLQRFSSSARADILLVVQNGEGRERANGSNP